VSPTALTAAPSLFDAVRDEPTLDELIVGAWEGLVAHRVVACPVCDEGMRPTYAAQSLPIAGTCQRCGTTLS
jgi:hypothetical protein